MARRRLVLRVHDRSPSGYSDASRQLYLFLIMTSNWVGSRCGQGRRSSTVPVTFLNVLGRCTAPPSTTSFRSFARKSSGMRQRFRTGAVACGCCKIQPPSWRNPDSTVPLSWARAPAEGDQYSGLPRKCCPPKLVRSLACGSTSRCTKSTILGGSTLVPSPWINTLGVALRKARS